MCLHFEFGDVSSLNINQSLKSVSFIWCLSSIQHISEMVIVLLYSRKRLCLFLQLGWTTSIEVPIKLIKKKNLYSKAKASFDKESDSRGKWTQRRDNEGNGNTAVEWEREVNEASAGWKHQRRATPAATAESNYNMHPKHPEDNRSFSTLVSRHTNNWLWRPPY